MIARLFKWLLPVWARPDHPLMRYEVSHHGPSRSRRVAVVQLAALLAALAGAALAYAMIADLPASGLSLSAMIWQSLYFPALVLQWITLVAALALGAAAVEGERSRKTWDNLRVTEAGAGAALRARWVGILYRLRLPILAILLLRLALVLGMLADLTAFGGHYAQMLGANASPPLPDSRLSLLYICLTITVNLLLPPAAIASTAAFGILIAVWVKERVYAVMIQVALAAAQLAFVAGSILFIASILGGAAALPAHLELMLFCAYSGLGDWGLLLAQLGSLGEIWHRLPYGVNISIALTALMFGQGILADGLIGLAERLAERQN